MGITFSANGTGLLRLQAEPFDEGNPPSPCCGALHSFSYSIGTTSKGAITGYGPLHPYEYTEDLVTKGPAEGYPPLNAFAYSIDTGYNAFSGITQELVTANNDSAIWKIIGNDPLLSYNYEITTTTAGVVDSVSPLSSYSYEINTATEAP